MLLLALAMAVFIAIFQKNAGYVSVSEALGKSQDISGKSISIKGIAKPHMAICTRIECQPENPCCNSCSSSLSLAEGENSIELKGAGFGCSGDSCSLECGPLENGIEYIVNGRLSVDGNRFFIQVEGFRKI